MKHNMLPRERVIADGGYIGDPKGLANDDYRRGKSNSTVTWIGKLRACHNKTNGCFKTWGCLRKVRHHRYEKHSCA